MSAEKSSSGKSGWLPSKDISSMLQGWDYEPGTINVRKIIGSDGLPKLQMRLDLGLLQMETDGRPDGQRPHGFESLLEFHEDRLKGHRELNGTELGFHLTPVQCQHLREESLMYHNRYLSLFVLGEYAGVARDTARNLRVLDLCGKYAIDDHDRLVLEQYRPYIIMMYTRATASIEIEQESYREAFTIVKNGLKEIKQFFFRFDQPDAYRQASEVRALKKLLGEIRTHLPPDPVRQLKKDLQRALKDERYEDAARLRDEIERLESAS
ncbi:MAG: UvrB/UvrC motif-containing protein [Tepidisphaerales bacterium]